MENLKRCLAGIGEIALVCDATVKRCAIEFRFAQAHGKSPKVSFLTVRQFLIRLEEIWEETRKALPPPGVGAPAKTPYVPPQSVTVSLGERDVMVAEQLRIIQSRMQRAKGTSPPGKDSLGNAS